MRYINVNDSWRVAIQELNGSHVEMGIQCNMEGWAYDFSILPDLLTVEKDQELQTLAVLQNQVESLAVSLY